MSKSHVSMENKICAVTGQQYQTGSILMDKRMKDSLEDNAITGYGISPEVQEKIDEGFIPLIEFDPSKTKINSNGRVDNLGEFYRTGKVAYIKKELFEIIFNVPSDRPFQFIEMAAFSQVEGMITDAQEEQE